MPEANWTPTIIAACASFVLMVGIIAWLQYKENQISRKSPAEEVRSKIIHGYLIRAKR